MEFSQPAGSAGDWHPGLLDRSISEFTLAYELDFVFDRYAAGIYPLRAKSLQVVEK